MHTIIFFKKNITRLFGRMRNQLLAQPKIEVSLELACTSLSPFIHVWFSFIR